MKTDAFLTRVRQICQLPSSDEDWTDAEILTEATQALYNRFAQPLEALRSGYWLKRITSNTTSGQAFYRMPPRAIVQGLEKIEISADNGTKWRPLSVLTDAETADYSDSGTAEPSWFSLEGDGVFLYPTPSSSSFLLRMSYYLRPNALIPVLSVGTITTINSTSIVVSGDMTSVLTAASGTCDIIQPDGCGEVAVVDLAYTSKTGTGPTTINFAAGTDTSRMAVGQYVRASDTTDVIPLPQEMQSALVEWTAATILAEKGDIEKAGVFSAKADNTIKRVIDAAIPRVKSRPYVWKSRNSFLRRRVGFGAGWR